MDCAGTNDAGGAVSNHRSASLILRLFFLDHKHFIDYLIKALNDLIWIVILTTVVLLFFRDDSFVEALPVSSNSVLGCFSLFNLLLFDLKYKDGWGKEKPKTSLPFRCGKVEEHHVPNSQERL